MPVDFSNQEAPQLDSSVSVKNPVSRDYGFLQGVSDIFTQAGDALKAKKKGQDEIIISNLTRKQILVGEGVDQGQYGSAYGRTLLRRNLMEAIDANPHLSQELVKAHADILRVSGGAKVVDEGTKEEQRKEARFTQLVSDGLISPEASDEEFMQADNYSRIAAEAKRRYEEAVRTMDLELKQHDLSSSRREQLEQKREAEAHRYLVDLAPVQLQGMRTRLDTIVNGAGTETEKVQAIQDLFTTFRSETTAIVGSLSEHKSSALMLPFEMLEEHYTQRATGELSDAELDRLNKRTIAIQEKLALTNPSIARTAALSKVLGSNVLVQIASLNDQAFQAVIEFAAGNSPETPGTQNPFPKDEDNRDGLNEYLNIITNGTDSGDEETRTEAIQHLNKVLEGVEDYEGILRKDASNGIELVNYFATPGFLSAVTGGQLSTDALQGASEVITRHYNKEVWGLVRREFRQAGVMDTDPETGFYDEQRPVAEAVTFRFSPAGVRFFAADNSDTNAAIKASQLNRDLRPIINNTIKAMSHLEGHSNYANMWEEVMPALFSGQVTDTGELETGDFSEDQPTFNTSSLPEDVAGDNEFQQGVTTLAKSLNIKPEQLMAVFDFETGGSFDPAQKNFAGSSATGLIQFLDSTAKSLGTTTEELAQMTRTEQLGFVEKYFNSGPLKNLGKPTTEDIYMSVLYPKAVGKPNDYVLFKKGTKRYDQNKGLDLNGDGKITKAEASREVVSRVDKFRMG